MPSRSEPWCAMPTASSVRTRRCGPPSAPPTSWRRIHASPAWGAGHQVAVVDNLATGSRSNLDSRAEFFEADVRDQPEIDRVFQLTRPAAVLHLAAQTLVAGAVSDPHRDAHINVLGTLSVLRAAAGADCRKVIFASSGGTVYGDARVQPVAETHPLNPISPYGVSKVAGEHYVRVLCSQAGLAYTILRYGNVYGQIGRA